MFDAVGSGLKSKLVLGGFFDFMRLQLEFANSIIIVVSSFICVFFWL